MFSLACVILSTGGGGGVSRGVSGCMCVCPGWGDAEPPPKDTPANGQLAVGTHPTGVHSCNMYIYIMFRICS